MFRLTPVIRMSLGLVLLTVSLLLVADWLGLTPDEADATLKARKRIAETLAVQMSKLAERGEVGIIKTVLRSVHERDDDILSASLRTAAGDVLATVGEHDALWNRDGSDISTTTHVVVPIFNGELPWGQAQIRFRPLGQRILFGLSINQLLLLVLFMAGAGYVLYHIFLYRSLRYLDPSAVIPARVKAAMDVLAEGVLILDDKERIVLANAAFTKKTGTSLSSLMGKTPSALTWQREDGGPKDALPWSEAIRQNAPQTAVPLSLNTKTGRARTFMVNSAPVIAENGETRGALTTFDDVTRLERRNSQLKRMLDVLKRSQDEVKRKNEELEVLATQDALTGCLNRRAFFQLLDEDFDKAQAGGYDIACVMLDIDHFKSINDRYGHGVGDTVIQRTARALQQALRQGDLVCRYGGEEFCLVLRGATSNEAALLAERVRRNIEALCFDDSNATRDMRVTSSFGVSDSRLGARSLAELIDQADQALYAAKEGGRNLVMRWDDTLREEESAPQTPVFGGVPEETAAHDSAGSISPATAFHDSLTGLPGRQLFLDTIRRHLLAYTGEHADIGLVLIDIDIFKRINQSLGHTAGDLLLRQVSERLADHIRRTDRIARLDQDNDATICRLGGDEFGILLQNLSDHRRIKDVASRLLENLSEPYLIGDHTVHLTISIGISVFPQGGHSAEQLLRNAEVAMYHAKERGGNTFERYSETLDGDSRERFRLEVELRHALTNDELVLFYQPKMETTTHRIVGMEALVRWRHPRLGLLAPTKFIAIAEETGLIGELGAWVLRTACCHAKGWIADGHADVRVAVNLSVLQLRDPRFVDQTLAILQDTGLEPTSLELEVTENAVMENLEIVTSILSQLKRRGVRISLDDFGIGYSSLNYIKRFPIDALKIDRSFIQNLTSHKPDLAIVSAIIAMAHAMELEVIAEGVENNEQLDIVSELSCDHVQGHIFSRPKPLNEAVALMDSGSDASEPVQVPRDATAAG